MPDRDIENRAIGRLSDRLTEMKQDTAEQMDRLGDRVEKHLDRIEERFTERLGKLDEDTRQSFVEVRDAIHIIQERQRRIEEEIRTSRDEAVGTAQLAVEEAKQTQRAVLQVEHKVANTKDFKYIWDRWQGRMMQVGIALAGIFAAVSGLYEGYKKATGK